LTDITPRITKNYLYFGSIGKTDYIAIKSARITVMFYETVPSVKVVMNYTIIPFSDGHLTVTVDSDSKWTTNTNVAGNYEPHFTVTGPFTAFMAYDFEIVASPSGPQRTERVRAKINFFQISI